MTEKRYLTEEEVDRQEHLSASRLKMLNPTNGDWSSCSNNRPRKNLIDLMHWVKDVFGNYIGRNNLNCWIHNKIVIDGSFMEFAEQTKVKITCLYRDSIASWQSDQGNEHFMAQGVFLIEYKNIKFIHSALFHKGNQNEDEVSFFVVVSDNDFETYTELRNEFDKWLISRDREHLEIHVIGGEGIPYERDMSWDEVFLPEKLKSDIKGAVEGFLNAKELYKKKKISWKRGLLLWGDPGCHAKGHPILMKDGSIKNVEDVQVGDFLMGPDGTSREVLKLVRGREDMYEIVPNLGDSFVVNKNHMLHLHTTVNGLKTVDITVKDYLCTSGSFQHRSKLRYSDAVEFDSSNDDLLIDPYLLGVWLGDGNSANPAVTDLKTYNLLDNKHIPECYLTSSIYNRLQLLAGLIDTDGGSSESHFKIIQRNKVLADNIVFLSRSLGFRTSIKKVTKTIKSSGFSGQYYRINISGNITNIPTKRKQAVENNPNKDKLKTGINDVTYVGVDDYYGFTLDKDHLYVDGNFMVHHNCGKTTTVRTIISNYDFKPVTVQTSPQTNDDTLTQAFEYAQEQEPGLLYFEDLDSLLRMGTVSVSHFLNLLDGISTNNGILVIATANDLSHLNEAIIDRPSRFDRKWEIPHPNHKMAKEYLKKWYGNAINARNINMISKNAVDNNFSYAYLKELYITSAYHALAAGRKDPNLKDIQQALEQLLSDKDNVKSGFVSDSHEEIGIK